MCLLVSHWNSLETGGLKLHSPSWDGHGVPRGAGQPSSWLTNDPFSKEKLNLVCAGWTQCVPTSLYQGWVGSGVPLGILDASLLGNFCFQKCSEMINLLYWGMLQKLHRVHSKAIRRNFTEGVGGCPASSHPCRTVPGSRVSAEHKLHSCHCFLCWLLQELALKTTRI